MERTLTADCLLKVGETVIVKGWLHNIRNLGKIAFLVLRDRKGYIQVVITDKKQLEKFDGKYVGTVFSATGKVAEAKQTELGVEIQDANIEIISPVITPPPVEYNKDEISAQLPTILDNRPITIRNKKIQTVFKVQATILDAFQESMRDQEFIEFKSPSLLETSSEGGADVFEVKYFDKKAFLAQSPQLYKQIMVGAFERVFTIGTVYRAEKHHTTRHLTELTQMDGEMAFVSDYHEIMEVCENVIRHIIKRVLKDNAKDLEIWDLPEILIPEGHFPEIKVRQGLEILEKRLKKSAKRAELDFDPEDEKELGKWVKDEHKSDFLWVTHFKKDKNFYTWNDPESRDESLSFDLHFRGIELLSGTVRIENYEKLLENIKRFGLKEEYFKGYLQAFQFGMPPEGGFSFGLERITMKIFDLDNVREATLFPRDVERLAP